MSIYTITSEHPVPGQDATLGHMVQWLDWMYRSGRDPFASLAEQAKLTGMPLKNMHYAMAVACCPGGHGPAIEESKRKFTQRYSQIKNDNWKVKRQ